MRVAPCGDGCTVVGAHRIGPVAAVEEQAALPLASTKGYFRQHFRALALHPAKRSQPDLTPNGQADVQRSASEAYRPSDAGAYE